MSRTALSPLGSILCADLKLGEEPELFRENPHHEALRNHLLTERYAGFRSIDVTEDWRALYRTEHERIIFVELGTHEQLYR